MNNLQLSLSELKAVMRAVSASIRQLERDCNLAENPIADKGHADLCEAHNKIRKIIYKLA